MFSRWWPRLTVVWPKSKLLTGSLGLINPAENLRRHSLPPLYRISSRDSTIRVEQLFLIKIRVTRWEIYSLTFLDSENSDGAKDTRCSPNCLNAVHEEADDGCVLGKLHEDKLHRWCRGTSLQASNGGTQASPRTESWSTVELGFFSQSSSSFFWRLSTKTAKQLVFLIPRIWTLRSTDHGLIRDERLSCLDFLRT
jgi:hypothetical protein